MYFIIKWLEPRLVINSTASDWKDTTKGNSSFIPLDKMDLFWYPDLDIYGMKTFDAKSVLKDMASFKVYKNKWLRYSARVDITLLCHMNFEDYPLDSHQCPFRVSSYYSPLGIVNCTSEVEYGNEAQPMLDYIIEIDPLPSKLRVFRAFGQDWATCGFNIVLHRTKIQNFFEVYLTCTLLVIVSWISFLIPPEVVPGRMGLLATILLVLINIFIGSKSGAPISNGLNAFDIFLVLCIINVFISCLEYAIVLMKDRIQDKQLSPAGILKPRKCSTLNENGKATANVCKINLDKLSLVFIPISFLIMILLYCCKYLI